MDSSLLLLKASNNDGTFVVSSDGSMDSYIPFRFGSEFVLRTPAGVSYHFEMRKGGLVAITDDSSHRVDITHDRSDPDDVVSIIKAASGGQTIEVHRDAQGRIVEIVDPAGQSILYEYGKFLANGDSNTSGTDPGNLGKITFRDNTHVVYQYKGADNDSDFKHHLTKIFNNSGVAQLTGDYDADGRLISMADASARKPIWALPSIWRRPHREARHRRLRHRRRRSARQSGSLITSRAIDRAEHRSCPATLLGYGI